MFPGTFAPWNKSSRELSLPGAKVPGNFRSRERMFSVGTFAPRSENTGERKVPEPKRDMAHRASPPLGCQKASREQWHVAHSTLFPQRTTARNAKLSIIMSAIDYVVRRHAVDGQGNNKQQRRQCRNRLNPLCQLPSHLTCI